MFVLPKASESRAEKMVVFGPFQIRGSQLIEHNDLFLVSKVLRQKATLRGMVTSCEHICFFAGVSATSTLATTCLPGDKRNPARRFRIAKAKLD